MLLLFKLSLLLSKPSLIFEWTWETWWLSLTVVPSSKIELSTLFVVLPIAKAKQLPTATLKTYLSSIVSSLAGWFRTLLSPTPISPFELEPQTTVLLSASTITKNDPPTLTLLTNISFYSLTFLGLLNSPKMPAPHTYIYPSSVTAAEACQAEIYLKLCDLDTFELFGSSDWRGSILTGRNWF